MKNCLALLSFLAISSFVVTPLHAQNVALGKTAVASSIENVNFPASLVNDGHGDASEVDSYGDCSGTCTRWASAPSDPQWIYIDLASVYNLTEVRINWEYASGRNFSIQVSNNAATWTTVQTITNNSQYQNVINMSGYTGRYVRMYGTARTTPFGYSIWEFEIYGSIVEPLGSNIAVGRPVFASSEQNPAVTAAAAVDGHGSAADVDYLGGCTGACTFWASDEGIDPQWIYVDLGARYNLRQAIVHWGFFNASSFQFQVSNDGATWTSVASVTGNTAYTNTVNLAGASGRYLRLLGTQRNTIYSYTVYELEVYGVQIILPVQLASFSAQPVGNNVRVAWSASLDKLTLFEAERSTDGRHFTTIAQNQVRPRSNEVVSYSVLDKNPPAGTTYYRLKYTEAGGTPRFSNTVLVNTRPETGLAVYPNPLTGNSLIIEMGEAYKGIVSVSITNTSGVEVYKQQQPANGRSKLQLIMPRPLPAGTYLVKVTTGSTTQSKTVVCL